MVLPISMCVLASACTTGSLQDPSTAPQSAPEQNVPLFANLVGKLRHRPLQPRRGTRPRRARSRNLRSYYSLGTTFPPGYRDAVGGPLHFDDAEILPALVPNGRGGDNELGLWTDHYHIASLTETPTEIVADVCDYRQRPTEVTKSSNAQVGFPWVVHLRNTTDTPPDYPGSPPIPTQILPIPPGPSASPPIGTSSDAGRSPSFTPADETGKARHRKNAPTGGSNDSPVPTLPTTATSSCLQAQSSPEFPSHSNTPEWIGPSEPPMTRGRPDPLTEMTATHVLDLRGCPIGTRTRRTRARASTAARSAGHLPPIPLISVMTHSSSPSRVRR